VCVPALVSTSVSTRDLAEISTTSKESARCAGSSSLPTVSDGPRVRSYSVSAGSKDRLYFVYFVYADRWSLRAPFLALVSLGYETGSCPGFRQRRRECGPRKIQHYQRYDT
jgi:hypothetical protein